MIALILRPCNDEAACGQHFNDILSRILKVQWQDFLDRLGPSSTSDSRIRLSGSTSCWLIDYGVFHHVNGNFYLLKNIHTINNFPIGLSDGKQVISTMKGDMKLCSNIVVQNMFYVPDLQ